VVPLRSDTSGLAALAITQANGDARRQEIFDACVASSGSPSPSGNAATPQRSYAHISGLGNSSTSSGMSIGAEV
jgi:hypothetical protein